MSLARNLYHRAIPERLRNPFGMMRRRLADRLRRATARPPLPPVELLANIQLTPFVDEYLRIGRTAAATVRSSAAAYGISTDRTANVLDFGCGAARVLRHLLDTRWTLSGCDIDAPAIAWASRHIDAKLEVNDAAPPLRYADRAFDLVFAISLFTHFSHSEQKAWIEEMARVIRPDGLLMFSTMGLSVIDNFGQLASETNKATLGSTGRLFIESDHSFNRRAAFHMPRGILALTEAHFELLSWSEQGLDGFQDWSVLRRKSAPV